MKLTNLSKLLIVLVLMVVLFFVFRKFIPAAQDKSNGDSGVQTEQSENVENNAKTSTTKSFSYVPKAPVNGTLRGVVELGASGFNSFIIEMDKDRNWKLEKAEWGNSLVYDGLASGEDVRTGLKKYISGMLDYGVPGKEIHFVVSSGAKTVETTQAIIDELKNMKYVVNTVTPEQEAQYALKSVLPPSYASKAFVVDIGSGNTKISWMEGSRTIGKESFGAKYYTNNTPDQEVFDHARNIASAIPKGQRKTCFIIGGVPFSLAKMDRIGEERYTVLRAPGDYDVEGAKMESGVNIYNAIKEGSGCDTFVFDWHANFTIGFLLKL